MASQASLVMALQAMLSSFSVLLFFSAVKSAITPVDDKLVSYVHVQFL